MPDWKIHREIDALTTYGKFAVDTHLAFGSGPKSLGGAPTAEVMRFARDGKDDPTGVR
jgi:hypothetical protein